MRHSLSIATAEPALAPTAAAIGATAVALEGVSHRYGRFLALDRVSLTVGAGEIMCLLGPSGSGKSTLLRLVAGIERPSAGRIVLDGVEVAGPQAPGGFVEPERRRAGLVFQDYALFPHLTVAENIAFGLRGRPRPEIDRIVAAMLDRVELARHAASYPHTLSGGERQRIALARALAPSPRVLLMDEPFSSLDSRLRDHVRELTLDLLHETRTTTIVVTHDPCEAMRIADRIALLRDGRLVQCGSADELYTRPATVFAARVFSDINEFPGTCHHGRVETPIGSFAAPQFADQSPATVCIRPQHLRIAEGPGGIRARVVRSEFLGEADHLVLAVPGVAAPVTLRAFGRTRLERGDTAYLDVQASDVLVVSPTES
jgi:iron(III) transport system ATP-binding protein